MQLKDRIAVVTGGASGIGLAMAARFVAEGARAVVVADRDGERARAAATCIGAGAHAMTLDVTVEGAIETLVDEVEARHGAIDLFCSNAGITAIGGAELPDQDWARVMDVNLMAHVRAARALLPRMLARGHGYLLQTASAAGLLSQFDAPYAVSKHAAVAFAEWLSITYGDRGIRVGCLCPGAVDTPLLRAESAGRQTVLAPGLIDADAVAATVVEAIGQERFLILTHDFVQDQWRRKAEDPERWLRGMRRLHAQAA